MEELKKTILSRRLVAVVGRRRKQTTGKHGNGERMGGGSAEGRATVGSDLVASRTDSF